MLVISSQQRLLWGSALILASAMSILATLQHRDTTLDVSQYVRMRPATGASSSYILKRDILITFPTQMSIDETRHISVIVNALGLSQRKVAPEEKLSEDVEVKLVSSGFDVQGSSIHKAGTAFPLTFMWTISPKKEGTHELLIGLPEIFRSSSSLGVMIDVTIGNLKVKNAERPYLPVEIKVTGQFGIPSWLLSIGAYLPGFLGFVLTYPLFVEWLKNHRSKPNKRLKGDAP